MRIGIVGAGALGGTFAALLARAGYDVEVAARGAGLDAIRANGIHLTGAYGDVHARVTANETLTTPPIVALLCTKAQDAPAALTANAATLDGTTVVVVQNGLDGVDAATRILPGANVFGLLSTIAANYTVPGEVTVTAAMPSLLGRGDGPADAETVALATMLSSAVPVRAIDNFRGAQWSKLVMNMLNAVPAVLGLSMQQAIRLRGARRITTMAMREAARVGIARGVQFGDIPGLDDPGLRSFAKRPLWLAQALPTAIVATMGNVPNYGSTGQSLRRGVPTEVDALNGAVVREAAAAGVAAPVNAVLMRLVHDVERTGRPITEAELVRSVRDRRQPVNTVGAPDAL
ncbi:MAG TPA: 2-dehydropantoate 2-reductase [Candidatus Lumbricidophila sp.]|nr:2-dehydropantoate 2-reductase [Candidatus Lumbricidophila sp.]